MPLKFNRSAMMLAGIIGASVFLHTTTGGLAGCGEADATHPARVIVLGLDGMDPALCREMFADGRLPNLQAIAEEGTFVPLATSTPPQSPVAWSNVITGTGPGVHGVFDFIHRDPTTALPFSSAAIKQEPPPLPVLGHAMDEVEMLGYRLPLRSARLQTNRHAPAFWEYLTAAGVPTHVFRMPANYPPTPAKGAHFCCLSDMGTVDLANTPGTFSYYTSDPTERGMSMSEGGGALYELRVVEHRAEGEFVGPANELVLSQGKGSSGRTPRAKVPFVLHRDPSRSVASIRWADQEVVLEEGEWSGWHPMAFELVPRLVTLKGMCRFLLKRVHPHVKLYVSPFNFDPQEESWEIDQPADWSVTVSNAVGRYYTQGLPEDTKALSNDVLSREQFLQQAQIVLDERRKLLEFAMDHYRGGALFFYFGQPDQIAHMFWGARHPGHPAITPEDHERYKGLMETVYERMDGIVGEVAQRFPDATLIVMSDHGFCDFRRAFNLNTWLQRNGYAAMRNPYDYKTPFNFDFANTRAYGLGINGLYVNLAGREQQGIVRAEDKDALLRDIAEKLKAYRDPKNGQQAIKEVYRADEVYAGPMVAMAPDLLIGYNAGYRGGGGSMLGGFPKNVVEDNRDAWCADHCVATDLVPGVLFTNRAAAASDASLKDIAPTILSACGVDVPEHMQGRDLFGDAPVMADERAVTMRR